jgi:hypothetical protein
MALLRVPGCVQFVFVGGEVFSDFGVKQHEIASGNAS